MWDYDRLLADYCFYMHIFWGSPPLINLIRLTDTFCMMVCEGSPHFTFTSLQRAHATGTNHYSDQPHPLPGVGVRRRIPTLPARRSRRVRPLMIPRSPHSASEHSLSPARQSSPPPVTADPSSAGTPAPSQDQLQHYLSVLGEYIRYAREYAQALHDSYADEVYALWHEHITYSATTDETSIASGTLSAVELEELTRKWVRLMREGRDMLHHETTIAADRAAAQDSFPLD